MLTQLLVFYCLLGTPSFHGLGRRNERNAQIIPALQLKHQFPALFPPFLPSPTLIATLCTQGRRAGDVHHSVASEKELSRRTGSIFALATLSKEEMLPNRHVSPKKMGLNALCILEAVEGDTQYPSCPHLTV